MTSGRFRPGYCSICAWEFAPELNKKLKLGWNARELNDWAQTKGKTFHRETLYAHKKHLTSGVDQVVQAAHMIPERDKIRTVSNDQFLEAIRDIGLANALQDPSSVNLNHSLKAVQILESKKEKPQQVLLVLAGAVMGRLPEPAIDGEVREITEGEA